MFSNFPALRLLRISIVFLISLFIVSNVSAGILGAMENSLIVSVLRAAAKTYLVFTGLEKIKQDSIYRIQKMDDKKFNKDYAAVQPYFAKSRGNDGFKPGLSKVEAATIIKSLTKKRISLLIDSVPPPVVAAMFRRYILNRQNLTSPHRNQ